MKGFTRILVRLSAAAFALGPAACSKAGDVTNLEWYGYKLGYTLPRAEHPEVSIDGRFGKGVEHPAEPWTSASLGFNSTTGELIRLEFRDEGIGISVCDVAPCPPGNRLKSVAQIRQDAERIRADLDTRLGKPTTYDGRGAIWAFAPARDLCGTKGIVGEVVSDPTGRLYRVSLHHSDDDVALDIVAVDPTAAEQSFEVPFEPGMICRR